MKDTFYRELPSEYKEVFKIDAKNKKTILFFVLGSFLILILINLLFLKDYISFFNNIDYYLGSIDLLIADIVFIVLMVLYVIFHELTHGIIYKIFTKEKLTFGLTLTVAYCGVPNIYVKRIPSLHAILAPFILYTIILLPLALFLNNQLYKIICIFLLSLHVSGCIGDLYDAILLLFKYKGDVLVFDNGPTQIIYQK